MHRQALGLRLGNGDLLHGVLQIGAGRFQLFRKIRAVQQFERRGLVAAEPAFQEAHDPLTGVHAVEVGGGDAGRTRAFQRGLALTGPGDALVENGDAGIFAGVLVKDLLADPHGAVARFQQLLRIGHRPGAVLRRHFQRQRPVLVTAREDLEVNLTAAHGLPSADQLSVVSLISR